MMNAYEIKTNKSDYPFLVVAGKMTDAIELSCRTCDGLGDTQIEACINLITHLLEEGIIEK